MEVIDFSAQKKGIKIKHHPMLPNSIRMIIIGPSGSGKTQLVLTLIMKYLKWDKLYLIAPSVDDQHCYQVLKDYNETASEIAEDEVIKFIIDIDEAPSIEDIDGGIDNLVVYDDVMLDKQKNPAKMFSRGRHKNIDIIYLTQRYTQIPKVIRDNCSLLCVFNGVDTHTLRNIWLTWCSDMTYNQFQTFFNNARALPYGFITINIHNYQTQSGTSFGTQSGSRYRIGLDKVYLTDRSS